MSKRFPAVTAKQVIKVLKKIDFVFYRSGKGSHEFYIRERDKRIIMISQHAGESIRRKTLMNILDAAALSIEDFKKLL